MTTQRDSYLQEIESIRAELGRLVEGMDYCLDWKPDDEEWSAREVVYHMVDTPSGGVHGAVSGILDRSLGELPVTAGLTNLTAERQAQDLEAVREDVEAVLAGMERALHSTMDAQLAESVVLFHSITRSTKEERTAQSVVEGLFLRHWREHLGQLAALRDALGFE